MLPTSITHRVFAVVVVLLAGVLLWTYLSQRRVGALDFVALFGIVVAVIVWAVTVQVQAQLARRYLESAERPSAPGAGKVIGPLIARGAVLSAKEGDHSSAGAIEIDGKRLVVVFRNFTFFSKFVGNPTHARIELELGDLVAGSVSQLKGRSYLRLRTTQGKVEISDNIQPFGQLADALLDIIEFNRTQPDSYRAARAREPIIQTPWYGWLILATALGAVVVVGWQVLVA